MQSIVLGATFALQRAPFKTIDPFLFCVHHLDAYPAGKENLGPDPKLLVNRDLGMDFSYEDGWSMYHGATVPGFPAHPHRGFETVTVVSQGLVDHCDSLGCTARYGNGDTQWLTAGRGVQHSEMMPLVHMDKPNPLDLFQIWLNLPRKDKMCDPAFSMFWAEQTPTITLKDASSGKSARVKVVAGPLEGAVPLPPPPHSWASNPSNDVAIWIIDLPAGCRVRLPPAAEGSPINRALYFVVGDRLEISSHDTWTCRTGGRVNSAVPLELGAVGKDAKVLLLQGRPINEPVVQHGPMVMNTREEVYKAFEDYQATHYGGWSFPDYDHTHPRTKPRHAYHNGKTELPPSVSQQ
mmetsp:Transcript_17466/g.19897  ORF Transcript_17466/g.19897 Transcript_17466/m.19897 type:complete len:350 (+) Transcript_17466:72-1121(+)